MTFTEAPFAYLLAATLVLWWILRSHYQATILLFLGSSLIFYGHNRWWLIGLILAYCAVDWALGLAIDRCQGGRRRLAVTIGIALNLSVLCFYKYTPLAIRSIAAIFGWLDLPDPPEPPSDWYLPFGISFYSFTGIAYMVDVYRRVVSPERSLLRFSTYMTFFPHLVAGPILRSRDLLKQLQPDTLPRRTEAPAEAAVLIARGFFKKMVLADRIAAAIDPFFKFIDAPATEGVWSLPYVYLYALQIYFDFSGYTDIARGLALWFGFRWPENFNLPYLAASVQDFWRRWHMTLSAFLRDYLYIPLGGGRCGPLRAGANLMITMLLGGLWHGATWSFLIWGGLHGAMLAVHRIWRGTGASGRLERAGGLAGALWRGAAILLTFHCVCLAWCFFRITELSRSLICVRKWFDFENDRAWTGGSADASLWVLIAGYGAAVLCVWLAGGRKTLREACGELEGRPLQAGLSWGLAAGLFFLAIILSPGGEKPPFIYFQF